MASLVRKISNALEDSHDTNASADCQKRQLSKPLLGVSYLIIATSMMLVTYGTYVYATNTS